MNVKWTKYQCKIFLVKSQCVLHQIQHFSQVFWRWKKTALPRSFSTAKNSLKRLGSNQVATCKEQGKASYLLYYLLYFTLGLWTKKLPYRKKNSRYSQREGRLKPKLIYHLLCSQRSCQRSLNEALCVLQTYFRIRS